MSKGLGKLQQAIIKALDDNMDRGLPNRMRLTYLVTSLYELHPLEQFTPSYSRQYSSVKRAVRTLEKRGIVGRLSTEKKCVIWLMCSPTRGTLTPEYIDGEAFDKAAEKLNFK